MRRKVFAIVMTAVMAFSTFTGCGSSASDASLPNKITIGTQNLADPEAIAKAEGWLETELGCPVDIVQFDGGRDVNVAMASGEIDFGMLGSVPAALAIGNGVDCKVIYIQSVLGDIESLVVNPKSGIKDAKSLKGKTIATVFSSTSHYSLLKYLEVNGVNPSDVDIIDMKAGEIVAAYTRGDIDGAFIWDPQVTELKNLGAEKLTSAKEVADMGYSTLDVEIVSTKFANKYPDIVKKYIQCMEKAVSMYKTDETAAGDSMAKQLGIPANDCLSQVKASIWLSVDEQLGANWFGGDILANGLYETAVFLYEQGDLLSKPDKAVFEKAVDKTYLR